MNCKMQVTYHNPLPLHTNTSTYWQFFIQAKLELVAYLFVCALS